MSTPSIVELAGIFLLVIGCGCVVAAASMVSVALAALAAGVFVIFAGALMVYAANAAEAKSKP